MKKKKVIYIENQKEVVFFFDMGKNFARTPEEGQRKNQDEVWDLERESKNYILMYLNLLSPHELMSLDFCYKTEPLTPLLIIFGSYLQ